LKTILWLVAFIVLFVVGGCFPLKPPKVPPPIVVSPPIAAIRSANDTVRSFRGVASTKLFYQGKSLRAKQAVAVAQPGSMRFETFGFLNQPLWILVTDGVTLQVASLSENRLYQGAVSEGLNQILGFRLTSQEFVSLFVGKLPDRMDGSVSYDPERGLHRLVFPPSSRWHAEMFWIHPRTWRVVEICKTDAMTGREIRVSFNRFQRKGSVVFPREITLTLDRPDDRVQFVFRNTEINPALPPELFRLTVPPGIEVVELGDDMARFLFPFWEEESTEP
jgi:hypothetical protein